MSKYYKTGLIGVLLLVVVVSAWASRNVQVVGLFKDRAVVVVNGDRQLLSVGGEARDGVRLLAANSESALLEVDGVVEVYSPQSLVHAPLNAPRLTQTAIWRDNSGLYQTTGSINGMFFSLLVDTGATQVAMNEHHARRLGIDYHIVGTPVSVSTASGEVQMYRINLKAVRLGELELRDVGALVLDGNYPDKVLLGMSFLNRVDIENEGRRLILRKKF